MVEIAPLEVIVKHITPTDEVVKETQFDGFCIVDANNDNVEARNLDEIIKLTKVDTLQHQH